MKKLLLLAATLLVGATMLKAQDTIVLRNGDELKVKVTEVNDLELKYKMWNNQDGPMYTKKVADIFMVKYKGGHREVYGATQSQHPTDNMQNNNVTRNANYGYGNNYGNGGGFMEHSGGDLILNGRKLNDSQIKEIFGINGLETYSSAKRQRISGKINVAMGWVEFGLGLAFVLFAEDEDILDLGILCLAASQIQLPLGFVLNGVGNGRISGLADKYNSSQSYSENMTVGFAPALVCAPDAAGNRSFGLGASVSLHF